MGTVVSETAEEIFITEPKALLSSSSETHEHLSIVEWSSAIDSAKPMIINKSKIMYRCYPSQEILQIYEAISRTHKLANSNNSIFPTPPLSQEELVIRAMAVKEFTNPTVH